MKMKWLHLLALFAFATTPLSAKDAPDDKGKNYERQRERALEDNKKKARDAWQKDEKEFKRELAAMEDLYQKANANPRTPENQELLKELIKKYPKSNRAGCAACYIGQFSRDPADAEKFLEIAIKEYSGCYYLNGTSVGGWARLLMIGREKQKGDAADAKKLTEEIRKDYADATNHHGELLVTFLDKE